MKYLFLLLFLPQIIFAEVDKFVFTTESQSLKEDVLSSVITFQAQDSLGQLENVNETFDIIFKSSSKTGLFLNSSLNPASKVMSKNTANKSFYYKDSTSGVHDLTLDISGRESGKVFTISQKIYIGTDIKEENINENNKEELNSDVSVYNQNDSSVLKIKNIKDKFGSVGNKILFNADVSGYKNKNYVRFLWNFGDGSVLEGNSVSHIYRFEGKYQVILKVVENDREAFSRFFVNIKKPSVYIKPVLGGVEMFNDSKDELLLDGWQMTNGISYFIFPENTSIASMQKIIFPKEFTGISGNNIYIKNNLDQIVSLYKPEEKIAQDKVYISYKNEPEIKKPNIVKSIKSTKDVFINEESTYPSTTSEVIYKSEVKNSLIKRAGFWFKNIFR